MSVDSSPTFAISQATVRYSALIGSERDEPMRRRRLTFERAVREVPFSFKLWYQYTTAISRYAMAQAPSSRWRTAAVAVFERAVTCLPAMPLLWCAYVEFLADTNALTAIRRAVDRALMALPATLHSEWIWPRALRLIIDDERQPQRRALSLYQRLVKFDASKREDFIDFAERRRAYGAVAATLIACLDDTAFESSTGQSTADLWSRLIRILVEHPHRIAGAVDTEAIIRGGILRYRDDTGRLYSALAEWHIRCGRISAARAVYEEAITACTAVRDFAIAYDAALTFEEAMLNEHVTALKGSAADDDTSDIELSLARLEYLIQRRPMLLSAVVLRQNPNNVLQWQKRIDLVTAEVTANDAVGALNTVCAAYELALATIEPQRATDASLHTLWMSYALVHADRHDLVTARRVLERATLVAYRAVDSLVSLYCEWTELELAHGQYNHARALVKRACTAPSGSGGRLHKSTRLWALHADLEENFGTFDTVRAAYDGMFINKAMTAQIVLDYAELLASQHYYEESFRVYERGINAFLFPQTFPLWTAYLRRFIARNGGDKLERTRDLFEEAISSITSSSASSTDGDIALKTFYVLYGKYEETFGFSRRAMTVYSRACDAVSVNGKYEMFLIWIARTHELYGVTATRPVYEKSITALPTDCLRIMCRRYARMEKTLSEVERARAIYRYGAQFADPILHKDYWDEWSELEADFGTEQTFLEMTRLERTVRTNMTVALPPQLNMTSNTSAAPTQLIDRVRSKHQRRQEQSVNGGEINVT